MKFKVCAVQKLRSMLHKKVVSWATAKKITSSLHYNTLELLSKLLMFTLPNSHLWKENKHVRWEVPWLCATRRINIDFQIISSGIEIISQNNDVKQASSCFKVTNECSMHVDLRTKTCIGYASSTYVHRETWKLSFSPEQPPYGRLMRILLEDLWPSCLFTDAIAHELLKDPLDHWLPWYRSAAPPPPPLIRSCNCLMTWQLQG